MKLVGDANDSKIWLVALQKADKRRICGYIGVFDGKGFKGSIVGVAYGDDRLRAASSDALEVGSVASMAEANEGYVVAPVFAANRLFMTLGQSSRRRGGYNALLESRGRRSKLFACYEVGYMRSEERPTAVSHGLHHPVFQFHFGIVEVSIIAVMECDQLSVPLISHRPMSDLPSPKDPRIGLK